MNLPPVAPTTPATGASATRPVSLIVAGAGQNTLALLGQLGAGDILAGTVLERASDGTLTIRTDRGILALSGNIEADVGSKLMLELRSAGARMQVVLLSVDGEPVDSSSLAAPKTGILTVLDAGKGMIDQTGDLSAVAKPTLPTLPASPTASPSLLTDAAAIVGERVIATLLRPNGTKPASPQLPQAPTPQTGQRLPYHLAAVLPPSTEAMAELPEPRNVFIATVRQQTAEGELVLDSPLGTIRLPNPSPATLPRSGATSQAAGENSVRPPNIGSAAAPASPPGPTPAPGNGTSAETPPDPTQHLPAGTRLILTLPLPTASRNGDSVPAGPRLTATVIRPAETQAPAPPPSRGMTATPQPATNNLAATNNLPAPTAGQKLPLELVSVLPPAGSSANGTASTASPASGPQTALLAILRAPSPNGQAILALPEGLAALDQHIEGTAGTRLLLLPMPHLPATPEAAPGPVQMFSTLLEIAALLDEKAAPPLSANATTSLHSSQAATAAGADARAAALAMPGPAQTGDLLAQNLPRVGAQLAAGLAYFIRARLSDKPAAWPGSELRQALQSAGRPELVAKLEQGFAELARAAPQTSQDGQWKTMVLPLLDEQALHQARLAIRRDPGKGDQPKDGKPAGVHFLLDVELSRMGALQLDGLVRGKRFDLMLRSHKPLDSQMQNEIQRLFAEAKSVTGITGEIYFQVAAVFASPDANAPVPPHAGGLIA
jgi:hypothetical protein